MNKNKFLSILCYMGGLALVLPSFYHMAHGQAVDGVLLAALCSLLIYLSFKVVHVPEVQNG